MASAHGVVLRSCFRKKETTFVGPIHKNGAETEGEDRGLVDNVELMTMEKFMEEA